MEPVVLWALGVGFCIFGLGMISAVASRKQRRQKPAGHVFVIGPKESPAEREDDGTGGLSMAAGGTGNVHVRKDDLAAISGSSR
jgi:NAD(P)H-flavin reductase